MTDKNGSEPGLPDQRLENLMMPRPNSPHLGEGSHRNNHRGYSPSLPADPRRSSGPPFIPSPETYMRNFGHVPAPYHRSLTQAPMRLPPASQNELCRASTPPPGAMFQAMMPRRGADSPHPSGYDYRFVPALDPKYECPICLMCLRDPVQTECGHRFCAECIRQSLREAGLRCPVDNEPLTETQMFTDICVKREILDLQVQCPFKDCPERLELRTVEAHKEGCIYRTEPCPNHCGAAMRRKSLDNHLESQCPKRLMKCSFCAQHLSFDELEAHVQRCPKSQVPCEFCHQVVLLENQERHLQHECREVPVPCQYAAFGCDAKLPKDQMSAHNAESMAAHLALMGSHIQRLNLQPPSPDRRRTYPEQAWRTNGPPPLSLSYNGKSEFPMSPASKIADVHEHGARKLNPEMLERTQASALWACPPPGGLVSPNTATSFGPATFDPWEQMRALKDKVKNLEEKEVFMRQKVIELESKIMSKDAEEARLREQVDYLQKEAKDLREHVAGGVFVWKLHRYDELRQAAERGDPTVRHSEGFYTGPCGYRLCLRVNINKSETRGIAYISLFVHFMQGKYDNFLDWPFSGSITLSIIDQNDDPETKRKNISEVLLAKTSIDAFKRPRTIRNHKGFGFMDFASVNSLEQNGIFVKEDTVLIKVEVHPQT